MPQEETDRQRTVTWEDPAITVKAMGDHGGLEWLGLLKDGSLPRPPIGALLGYRLKDFGPGWALFEMDDGQWLYNPIGMIHGGALATLMDSAMGCAVHSTLPKGVGYSTIEFKVNFVHPVKSGVGRVFAEAKAIHVGKSIATAEATVKDGQGRLYAHAVCTCMILRAQKA
ncbi:thioesterase superfamily protein [Desulfarculus baarsii DSM 2075]|uniref:Thioesterase superfamily protein n=1 Tax=Desulfarculus baarsii (strain ATCC 33931 / DSM 2075 / LMG 7858 / VKM B-1802 / 2st14) TaxID=644282 RepID=E1QFL2_DESB2|nr:PaaI family thioesterase [Desulfarculus baarsii]ADK84348.1 thioesterase superfamily protein [Desulfarculus baarsii DSM 2075]